MTGCWKVRVFRQQLLPHGDDRNRADFGRGDDRVHAGPLPRRRRIDAADAAVRDRTAQDGGVQRAAAPRRRRTRRGRAGSADPRRARPGCRSGGCRFVCVKCPPDQPRHARPCAGHPRLAVLQPKDVDGRDKPGHDVDGAVQRRTDIVRATQKRTRRNAPRIRSLRPRRPQRAAARRVLRGPVQADRSLRPRRLLRLSLRRAPFHAARHGALAQRVSFVGGAAHQEAPLRPAGLHAGALPSAAARRRNLHARPDEPRALPGRRRQGRVADRDRLLRRRHDQDGKDFRGVLRRRHAGADAEDRQLRGRALQLQERADGDDAVPAAASAAVVRRGQSGQRRPRRQGRHELHQQRAGRRDPRQDRALHRDRAAVRLRRAEVRHEPLHGDRRHRRARRWRSRGAPTASGTRASCTCGGSTTRSRRT